MTTYFPKRYLTVKFIFALLFISILYSCNEAHPKENEEAPTTAIQPAATITSVITATSNEKPFEYLISSNGKIKSLKEQLIITEGPARLLNCMAQNGKHVAAGSIIAQLETTIARQKLEKAELARFNGEKEYQSQLLGYENLLKGKPQEQAEEIKQKLRISTGLAGAEQDIKEARQEIDKALIRAPFSGMLADVKVQQGQQLKAGEEMFRIYDPSALLLEVKILEADVTLLKQGTPAEVSPVSNEEVKYKASLAEINPYVDENGMVLIKLKIASPLSASGVKLFPGMNCTAVIKVPFQKTLVVPKEAVVMRSGKAVVFTLEDGKAKWNYVTTGRDNGKEMEIKEGLKAGQKVITSNNLQLAHDAPVKEDSTGAAVKAGEE